MRKTSSIRSKNPRVSLYTQHAPKKQKLEGFDITGKSLKKKKKHKNKQKNRQHKKKGKKHPKKKRLHKKSSK